MPVGYVIEQHPAAGESVTQSGSVWLTVKASPDVQKVVIPNVQSMNIADALGVLKLRDLSLFFIYEKGSSEQKGVVISQSPQENTELATDKPVMLTIPEPEGRRYRLSEPIPGDIDGTPVYYIIYDTMVESGDHAIEPTGTIIMDSDEETIQKDIVIFLDGIQVKTESVEFTRR